jgi:hypothetical protein
MDSLKSRLREQDLIKEIENGYKEIGCHYMEIWHLASEVNNKEKELAKIFRERKEVV